MCNTMPITRSLIVAALLTGVATPAWAVDGTILIDQNKAMTGNVTPGDTPGFPVTISLPGSYKLAGNLTVPDENTTAILITASNVALDLNGFSILGPTVCARQGPGGNGFVTCAPTGSGIGVSSTVGTNITVRNGTIRGMGSSGILLQSGGGTAAPPSLVEKMSAHSNGGSGISLDTGLVLNNVAGTNGIWGIAINSGNVFANHLTNNNSGGLFMGAGGYTNNVFMLNGFNSNGTQVFGGTNNGQNFCNNATCGGAQL